MITRQLSLNKLFFLLSFLSFSAMANTKYCPQSFEVLERDKKDGYRMVKQELEKLFCTDSFEGEHFKIVYATDDTAIAFNHEDKDLLRRAANVYHHLTVARNFWLSEINSTYVPKIPQIIVRLEITNAFSSTRHFMHAEQEKNYNNAWTIPEGQTPRSVPAADKKKWNKEIWFSPMKKIETRELVQKSEGNNPLHEGLDLLKTPVIETNKNGLIFQSLGLLRAPQINNTTLLNTALSRLGTIAVIFGLWELSKHMDFIFMDKYYYIDTAMIPEIIYHEYAHIALSDTMKTVHSVPVIEGMADYFAARIANRRKMYEKIEEFSSNKTKDIKSKQFYHPFLEGAWNATSDYTLSLLWLGKTEFDKVNEARAKKGQPPMVNYDELIYQAHFDLNEFSNISEDLTAALIKSCQTKCDSKRSGVHILHNVFEKKGLN
jgi:hypothetical protein